MTGPRGARPRPVPESAPKPPMARLSLILDLEGTPCVVVGAGPVAARKARALVAAGARVVVVAPQAGPGIRDLARRGALRWRRKRFSPGDLRHARLVVAATSETLVNRGIGLAAGRRGQFVDVADDPALCTLLMPAVLARGPLQISVSTSGESPALARALRDDLKRSFGAEYASYVRIVGEIRRRLQAGAAGGMGRDRRYRRLLRAPILALLRRGRGAEARRAALRAAELA
jgi:precorrin-2 dehydrogenase / sirohydrochlorin ferrochelatase